MPDKPAIIYARFSTPSQEQGDSLNRQLGDCRAFCELYGLTVVDEIFDLGRSAYKGDHLSIGELGKLTQSIMAGEIPAGTTIVVEKMDRLSRQKPRVVQRWIEDVCDRGLRIAIRDPERFIDAKYLDEGSNTIALLDILMNSHAANIFSKNLSDRLGKAWKSKRANAVETGKVLTSVIPAWLYVDDGGTIRVDVERGKLVRRIYEMTAEGIGAWTIANTFNDESIEPWGPNRQQKAAKVRGWNHTYIRNVILSPAVDGDHYFTVPHKKGRKRSGEVLRGYFPMVEGVDADLIARARSVVQQKGSRSGGRFAAYGRNLFSTIALCAHCGSKMVLTGRGIHSPKPAYLQCDGAKKHKGCDRKGTFDYKALEPAILSKILAIALDDRFFQTDDTDILRLTNAVAEAQKLLNDADEMRRGYSSLLAKRPDDGRLNADYDAAAEQCDILEEQLEIARKALSAAKGATSPAEHARRVLEVSDAMQSEDEEVMAAARRRVHASLKEVIYRMECKQELVEGQEKLVKTVSIALNEGLIVYTFDNAGNVLFAHEGHGDPIIVNTMTAGPMSYNAPAVAKTLQRAKSETPKRTPPSHSPIYVEKVYGPQQRSTVDPSEQQWKYGVG